MGYSLCASCSLADLTTSQALKLFLSTENRSLLSWNALAKGLCFIFNEVICKNHLIINVDIHINIGM